MNQSTVDREIINSIKLIDHELSKRFINLDPKGYFIIKLDNSSNEILVEHYTNDIDEAGIAINPQTGKPIKCSKEEKRPPVSIYRGKSAKQVGIQIIEENQVLPLSKLDHALYLGRELQRAEECLKKGATYIQD